MREIYAKNTNNILVRKQIKKALCVDMTSYVNGIIDKWKWTAKANFNTVIGEEGFKEIMVSRKFAESLGVNLT